MEHQFSDSAKRVVLRMLDEGRCDPVQLGERMYAQLSIDGFLKPAGGVSDAGRQFLAGGLKQ